MEGVESATAVVDDEASIQRSDTQRREEEARRAEFAENEKRKKLRRGSGDRGRAPAAAPAAESSSTGLRFHEPADKEGWKLARKSFKEDEIGDLVRSAEQNAEDLITRHHSTRRAAGRGDREKTRRRPADENESFADLLLAAIDVAEGKNIKHPWYVMDPQGTFMSTWELMSAVVLLFIAVFTPVEVSLLKPTFELFVLGRAIDIFFICDMVLQFVTMVPKSDAEPGRLESNPRKIAIAYIRGWFFLDFVALGSSFFDFLPLLQGGDMVANRKSPQSVARIVRVFRLIKLLRLLKASRIIKSWSVKIATPRATVTIVWSLLQCLFVSHLVACTLALSATLGERHELGSWYGTLGYCRPQISISYPDVADSASKPAGLEKAFSDITVDGMLTPDWQETLEALGFTKVWPFNASYDLSSTGYLEGLADRSNPSDYDEVCREIHATAIREFKDHLMEYNGLLCSEQCVDPAYQYLQSMWWSLGMLMGAPISLTPYQGPYAPYFAFDTGETLNRGELLVVIMLKCVTAFLWTTVIARFVQVYNNLDPDARDFRLGWDALNRFVSYFKVPKNDALELRRFYIERSEEAKQKSRMRVMNDFSPLLTEKFVWKLNKEWLVRVPCFSLVVERLLSKPESGMERFLVKVALAMQPSVFVPTERPPPLRLYMVTQGVAIHKGKKCIAGASWGAEEVLLRSRRARQCHRAVATTYLHVLWIGAGTFDDIKTQGPEFLSAYRLVKLWATIYATGNAIVEQHRKMTKAEKMSIGLEEGQFWPEEVERRVNKGLASVIVLRGPDNLPMRNHAGQTLYTLRYQTLELGNYEIVKIWSREVSKFLYRVLPKAGTPEHADLLANAESNGDLLHVAELARHREGMAELRKSGASILHAPSSSSPTGGKRSPSKGGGSSLLSIPETKQQEPQSRGWAPSAASFGLGGLTGFMSDRGNNSNNNNSDSATLEAVSKQLATMTTQIGALAKQVEQLSRKSGGSSSGRLEA